MSRRLAALVLASLVLTGCATATPYQAVNKGHGYSEQRLEADRYRVSFAGNTRTSYDTVADYLLYRAAELTLENGYDYFIVTDRGNEGQQKGGGPSVGIGLGGFRFGGSGGFGINVGTSTSVGEGGGKAYRAHADVQMRKGQKPEGDVSAFDAREVKANLESIILRPAS